MPECTYGDRGRDHRFAAVAVQARAAVEFAVGSAFFLDLVSDEAVVRSAGT